MELIRRRHASVADIIKMYVSSESGQRNLLTRSGLTEVSVLLFEESLVTVYPDVDSFVLAPLTWS
jgi:ABC-type arginine transport system ATPase subunit